MIPQGGSISNVAVQETQQPSLTWRLDFESGRVVGKIDGLDAVRQAVFKILQTDRFWHDIYTFDYGHELGTLIGDSPLYVQSEVSRMISEALLQDDRISAVDDIDVAFTADRLTVSFTVVTEYGSFEEEVIRDV
jgi:phage baseplate assembly protein W